jgi:hypothetical protein
MKTSKFFASTLAAASLAICLSAQANEPTVARKVESMDVDGSNGLVKVRGIGAWGIHCGGGVVDTVYFDKTTAPGGYASMLALITGAYISGKFVRFYGDCSTTRDRTYYEGTYVIISDK